MPKYSSSAPKTRVQVESSRNPERLQVVARPVSTYVAPYQDDTASQLVNSLKAFNPALGNLQKQMLIEQSDKDELAAKKALATGQTEGLTNDAHDMYMVLDGNKRGDEDAAALKQEYLSFDKDTGDFDSWAQQKIAERTQGINDPAFLKGYLPNIQKAVGELKSDWHKYQQARVSENQQANVLNYIQQPFTEAMEKGQPVDLATLQLRKQDLKDFYGMSYGDQVPLLLQAADSVAGQGFYQVVDAFKQPNADGTPAIYDNPKYRPMIDAMEFKAKRAFVQMQAEVDKAEEERLENLRDELVRPAFEMALTGDPDEAKIALTLVMTKNPKIFRAEDIVKWTNSLNGIANAEASADQKMYAIDLFDGVHSGRVGIRQIMYAARDKKITYQQARDLTNEVEALQAQARQEQRQAEMDARQDRREQRAEEAARRAEQRQNNIFTTPEYKAAMDYVDNALPVSNRPGLPGMKPRQKADVMMEFRQRVINEPNRDPASLNRLANEVVDRYTHLKGSTPYKSFAQIQSDLKARKITPGDAAFHMNLLKQKLGMNK